MRLHEEQQAQRVEGTHRCRDLPVTVNLSYDDGRTWHRAVPDHALRVSAPRTADFVSLRASARDSAGNAVSQTVKRAFGLR